jgi:hypothetical protein
MNIRICALFLPALCLAGTLIQDTIYTSFPPQAFEGRVTISGPAMTTFEGKMISRWTRDFQISGGQFQVELEPNDTAVPSGTSYYVVYRPKSGMAWSEYWVVPTSGTPLKIAGVRVSQPPAPQMTIQPSQILAGGASDGQTLVNGVTVSAAGAQSTLSAGVSSIFGTHRRGHGPIRRLRHRQSPGRRREQVLLSRLARPCRIFCAKPAGL